VPVPFLTPQQQQIIAHQNGHARVVAVAGAGKTTTLTHFIAARLAENVPPKRMLVLMYNRSARVDFEQKLQQLLPNQLLPEVRTFHSLALRIYQRLIAQKILPAYQEKILSDGEMEGVLWRIMQQLADEETRQDILSQRKKWVEPALSFVDLVKAGLDTPEQVLAYMDLPPNCQFFVTMFHEFEQWRKAQRRISYADMLYDIAQVFRQNPQVAAQFGGHMQWILVDEYQDINAIQQYLLETLHAGRGAVMVIGDPDQTIYEFRGSRPEFILKEFTQKMGQVSHYTLPHTFRYGHALSLVANHLIGHNLGRDSVLCVSHTSTLATQVHLHQVQDETSCVLKLIAQVAMQHEYRSIAIINRLWAICAPLELALLQAGIPYNLHSSQSVLERAELNIFYTLFAVADGSFSHKSSEEKYEAWLTLLTTPYPKIKRVLLEQIAKSMLAEQSNYAQALLKNIPKEISEWQAQSLHERAQIIADAEMRKLPAFKLVQDYIQGTHLLDGIADSAFSAQQIEDRISTIRAFAHFVKDSQWSSQEALGNFEKLKQQRQRQNNHNAVQLISIHKSKGLEWPVVIIPGFNAHYYPYEAEGEFTTPSSLESERRLLYVAMTRAQQELHLIAPDIAVKAPKNEQDKNKKRSRFHKELHLGNSTALAQAWYQKRDRVELTEPLSPWLEHYASTLGCQIERRNLLNTVTEKLRPFNPIVSKKAHPKITRRIHHSVLGVGEVVSEDEKFIKVRFAGEDEPRTLLQATLHEFLLNE
jgi:DNA helicase-2/ATP-dependent DNA helicase PcrA